MRKITFFVAILFFAVSFNALAQQAVKQSLVSPKKHAEKEAVKQTVEQEEENQTGARKQSLGGAKKTTAKTGKTSTSSSVKPTLKGYVASLNDLNMGGDGKVTAAQAQNLLDKGQLLVLKATNGHIYMVYNTDGSFAGKKLSKLAGGDIGIVGKLKSIHGVRVILAAKYIQM